MKPGETAAHGLIEHWHRLSEAERAAVKTLLQQHRARNVNEMEAEGMTAGDRIAEDVTRWLGSWRFIIVLGGLMIAWMGLNVVGWTQRWDPYPFILLNLVLGFQAAFAAPVILMSENREAAKDRLRAEEDYRVNLRAELEVAAIQARLDELLEQRWAALLELQQRQLDRLERLEAMVGVASADRAAGDG